MARSTAISPMRIVVPPQCQPIGKPLARSTHGLEKDLDVGSSVSRSESRWPDRQGGPPVMRNRASVSADRKAVGQIDLRSRTRAGRGHRVSADRKAVGQIDTPSIRLLVPAWQVSADRKAVGQIDPRTTTAWSDHDAGRCQPIGKPLARSTTRSTWRLPFAAGVSRSESRWPDRPKPASSTVRATPGVSRSESRWPDRLWVVLADQVAPLKCQPIGKPLARSTSKAAWRRQLICNRVSRSESRWPDRPRPPGSYQAARATVSADRKAVGQIDSVRPSALTGITQQCQPIGKPLARSTSKAAWRRQLICNRVSRSESRWPDRQTKKSTACQ